MPSLLQLLRSPLRDVQCHAGWTRPCLRPLTTGTGAPRWDALPAERTAYGAAAHPAAATPGVCVCVPRLNSAVCFSRHTAEFRQNCPGLVFIKVRHPICAPLAFPSIILNSACCGSSRSRSRSQGHYSPRSPARGRDSWERSVAERERRPGGRDSLDRDRERGRDAAARLRDRCGSCRMVPKHTQPDPVSQPLHVDTC